MKKLFLVGVVAVMTALSANAQDFNKGDWFVGARSTGLNFDRLSEQKTAGSTSTTATTINLDGLGLSFGIGVKF